DLIGSRRPGAQNSSKIRVVHRFRSGLKTPAVCVHEHSAQSRPGAAAEPSRSPPPPGHGATLSGPHSDPRRVSKGRYPSAYGKFLGGGPERAVLAAFGLLDPASSGRAPLGAWDRA